MVLVGVNNRQLTIQKQGPPSHSLFTSFHGNKIILRFRIMNPSETELTGELASLNFDRDSNPRPGTRPSDRCSTMQRSMWHGSLPADIPH